MNPKPKVLRRSESSEPSSAARSLAGSLICEQVLHLPDTKMMYLHYIYMCVCLSVHMLCVYIGLLIYVYTHTATIAFAFAQTEAGRLHFQGPHNDVSKLCLEKAIGAHLYW